MDNDIERLLCLIEKNIYSGNVEQAKIMMNNIDKKKYCVEYSYLMGLINEHEAMASLDDKKLERYAECMNLGKQALLDKEYMEAYKHFLAGYEATKINIFYYYIGKAFFGLGNWVVAYPYFQAYLRLGGSKLPKSLLYIMSSYLHLGKVKKARKYYKELKIINDNFKHGYNLKCPFRNAKYLKLENYYNCDFEDKTYIIENLFRNGDYNIAIKLLEELEPESKAQKKRVNSILKNKTLYKNKRK